MSTLTPETLFFGYTNDNKEDYVSYIKRGTRKAVLSIKFGLSLQKNSLLPHFQLHIPTLLLYYLHDMSQYV